MMKYLSTEFHEWPFTDRVRSNGDFNDVFRAHQLWSHAQDLLRINDDELYRSDCIANLKRAINHRLQAIERIYKITKLPLPISTKKVLDRYEYLGLIRPAVLHELIKVRNVIEHQDETPPTTKKCMFYIDIVWYFLKSTDSLVDHIVRDIEFEDEGNMIVMNVEIETSWVFTVTLDVVASLLSSEPNSDSIELSRKVLVNDDNRVKVTVELQPSDRQLNKLVNEYFASANYWHEDRPNQSTTA